jgi:hypothetical protein
MGDKGSCEVCAEQTIRQCTICQRWVCMRHRGQCPCLVRYLAIGADDYRVAHVLQPDADIKAGLPCGTKALFNVRFDKAPEAGAKRCAMCFADGVQAGEGWGTRQTTVSAPLTLYPDPNPKARKSPRRAVHQPGADSTPEDYIDSETHRLTPEQVLLLDAATGLPIAEEAMARLSQDAANALDQVRSYENQASMEKEVQAGQFYQAQARLWFEHRARVLGKVAEWQAVHSAYLATLLASAMREAV